MLSSLTRRRSAVSSNWKSRAHTSLGRWVRSRAAVPSVAGAAWPCAAADAADPRRARRAVCAWGWSPAPRGAPPHGPCATPGVDCSARSPADAHAGGPQRPRWATWRGAGSSGAVPLQRTPGAQTPRTAAGRAPPRSADGPGSPFSLGQLLEHRLVQLRPRQKLLAPAVLGCRVIVRGLSSR